jgi:hypothetical protein
MRMMFGITMLCIAAAAIIAPMVVHTGWLGTLYIWLVSLAITTLFVVGIWLISNP